MLWYPSDLWSHLSADNPEGVESGNERIFGFLAVDAHRALAMLRFVDVDSQVALAIGKDEEYLSPF